MAYDLPLYMCGSCGMRQFVKPKVASDQKYYSYRYINLKDLDPLLKFDLQQQQKYDTCDDLTKKLSSVYASVHLESNGLFYIHPETVDDQCGNQWDKGGKGVCMWGLLVCN